MDKENTQITSTTSNLQSYTSTENSNFIPYIKIISSNTKEFKAGKAKLGDFFCSNGVSLGSSVDIYYLTYRYKLTAQDKKTLQTINSLIEKEGDIPFPERETYRDFLNKNRMHKLTDCVDLLLYLVDNGLFVVLQLKGKIKPSAYVIDSLGKGGSILNLTTKLIAPDKLSYDWYEIEVISKNEPLEKDIEATKIKALTYFNSSNEVLPNDEQER